MLNLSYLQCLNTLISPNLSIMVIIKEICHIDILNYAIAHELYSNFSNERGPYILSFEKFF